jgi:tetratricopeptide (TPR) repeat protein
VYNSCVQSTDRLGVPVRAGIASFVLILLLGCGKSVDYYVEKGNALSASGKFAEAELNYRKALQKDSNSGEAYYRLALDELKQNKGPQAYQSLLQAVRVAPEHQAARTELANLALTSYLADPQHPKVLYDLLLRVSGEWLKKDPASVDGLRIKGYLAMEERRPDEAADLFRRALQSNPKQEKITLGLMDALYRNKQSADAEKVGLDFIAADKTAGDVYDALYRLYEATNRPADAESILAKKVTENPQKGEYILQLAGHYARVRKKAEMEAALQSFLANPTAGPKAHVQVGDFYAAVGDWPAALEQYQAGVAANPKDAPLYQDRIARSLLSQDKRDEGLKVLNATIAQNPDDKEAQALRAALLLGNGTAGKPGEALQEFQSLVEKNPDDIFLRFVLSKAQLDSGDLAGARIQLLEVVKRRPQFLEAQILLAETSLREHNFTQAILHAGAVLELNPNNYRAQLVRGTSLLRLGNLEEAGSVLGRLSRQAPQSVDVRLQLASLALRRKNFGEAEADYRKILDDNRTEWRAMAGLVDTDLAQNRLDRALGRLEQELARSHGEPHVRYLMAVTAIRGGKYNLAIENLQQLAAQNSDSIDSQLELAGVFRLKGDVHNAIATLQKAAFLKPKDPRPAAMLPFLLQMDNRKQEAKLQARRALSLEPTSPASINNLAYLLAETGDSLEEALQLARQATSKAPGEPYFADTLGFVYLKKDQNDDALEIFNKLVRKYPDESVFAYHMGMAWYQKGEMIRAKAELTRALGRKPSKETETGIKDLLSRIN